MSFNDKVGSLLTRAMSTFGEEFDYVPDGGPSYKVTGIFDNQHEELDLETGAMVVSNEPRVGVKANDLNADPSRDDQVIINSITYDVVDSQEDGRGGLMLMLREL